MLLGRLEAFRSLEALSDVQAVAKRLQFRSKLLLARSRESRINVDVQMCSKNEDEALIVRYNEVLIQCRYVDVRGKLKTKQSFCGKRHADLIPTIQMCNEVFETQFRRRLSCLSTRREGLVAYQE